MKKSVKNLLAFVIVILLSINFSFSQTIIWDEDFEGNWISNWFAESGSWNGGQPTNPNAPDSAYNGLNCASNGLNSNYSGGTSSRWVRIPSFLVPDSALHPRLRFWHWYSFTNGFWGNDYGNVQIRIVGTTDWIVVSPNYYGTCGNVWTYPSIALSSFSGKNIQVAFFFQSTNGGPGWFIDNISFITGPETLTFPEGFENGIGNWYSETGTWVIGHPSSGPDSAYSGQNCAATNLSGNYLGGLSSRLISPYFIVPDSSQLPRLRFWHWYSFTNGFWGNDNGVVQIKEVGSSTWTTISPTYSGTGGNVWTCPSIDIKHYAGKTVQIAFLLQSTNGGPGWYIDNIVLKTGPDNFYFPEGFEGGMGNWYSETGTWQIGKPTGGPNTAHNGMNCAATTLAGNYPGGTSSRLISPTFIVPDSNQKPRLRFWHWYTFTNGFWGNDNGTVQIKVADSLSWITISPTYSGTCGNVWTYTTLDLSSYSGKKVQIAFFLQSTNGGPGWFIDDINLITGTYEQIFPEGFEQGIRDWYAETGIWEIGKLKGGPHNPHSGINCGATLLSGNYPGGCSSRLISAPFTVPDSIQTPALRFWHWYSFTNGFWGNDYGVVQIKELNSNTWINISPTYYNSSSNAWTFPYIDLLAYAGKKVQIAFLLQSTNGGPGWFIDDIELDYKRNHDVGVDKILCPKGIVKLDSIVVPQAIVRNFGLNAETFNTKMFIDTLYSDTKSISLLPNHVDTLTFLPYYANTEGAFIANVKTLLSTDENNSNDSATSIVIVSSGAGPEISSASPYHIGNYGYVNLTLTGNRFFGIKNVRLIKSGSEDIIADTSNIQVINFHKLIAKFSFDSVSTGKWEICITDTTGKSFTYHPGIYIDETNQDLWVNFVGPSPIGIRHPSDYFFNIENSGNVDAYCVPFWIVVPQNCELVVKEEIFSPLNDSLSIHYDSIPLGFTVDSLFGQPYNCQIFPLILNELKINEIKSLHITLKPTGSLQNLKVQYWLGTPTVTPILAKKLKFGNAKQFLDCLLSGLQTFGGMVIGNECASGLFSMYTNLFAGKYSPGHVNWWTVGRETGSLAYHCFVTGAAPEYELLMYCLDHMFEMKDLVDDCKPFFTGDGEQNEKNIPVSSSYDPNFKSSPLGVSSKNFVSSIQPFYYYIHFENVDTATAPAFTISVIDTLSSNLDWQSFSFDSCSLKPTFQNFDKLKGIAKWEFDSIILPPNVHPPEGEGWVKFKIFPKNSLQTGIQIINRASVKFDFNDLTLTNSTINFIDAVSPVSNMKQNVVYLGDLTYLLSWTGHDEISGSGIKDYTIYYTEDPNGIYPKWKINIADTFAIFKGETGKSYYFYSIARDNVGHIEPQKNSYELMLKNVGINEQISSKDYRLKVYPNPAHDKFYIEFNNPNHSEYELTMLSIVDKPVKIIHNVSNEKIVIEKGDIPPGIYFIRLQGEKTLTGKIVIN